MSICIRKSYPGQMANGGAFEIPDQTKLNAGDECDASAKWSSLIEPCQMADYKVVPLTDVQSIQEEQELLQQSHYQHDSRVYAGTLAMFAIRDRHDQPLAMVQLSLADGYWLLDYVRGYNGHDISQIESTCFDGDKTVTSFEMTDLYYVALAVQVLYQKAWDETGRNF